MTIIKDSPFRTKVQPSGGFGYYIRFMFLPYTGMSIGGGVRISGSSNTAEGFTYKGYGGFFLSLGLLGKFPVAPPAKESNFWIGMGSALRGSYVQYELTSLYFFFLSLLIDPFVEIIISERASWKLAFSVPVMFDFRQDTDLSMSVGAGIHLVHAISRMGK